MFGKYYAHGKLFFCLSRCSMHASTMLWRLSRSRNSWKHWVSALRYLAPINTGSWRNWVYARIGGCTFFRVHFGPSSARPKAPGHQFKPPQTSTGTYRYNYMFKRSSVKLRNAENQWNEVIALSCWIRKAAAVCLSFSWTISTTYRG